MTMFFVSSIRFEPSSPVTSTWPGAAMRAGAGEGVDLVLLEQELDALGVALDALLLEGQHLLEVEAGRADADAEIGEMVPRILEHVGGVQERLRGNAADVQAGAAMGLALLDHGGPEAELGGPDGAHIAPGAGADDDEIVGHIVSPPNVMPGPDPGIHVLALGLKAWMAGTSPAMTLK
jgi:hypothetical protein